MALSRAARVRVLPSLLVDQIAAGEVVERPASVVKELCENALDAGALRIDVDIERGGLELVRVSDDGSGMGPEDAHLALRRHATSKLFAIDDLLTLGTMGFRGEALPSIASVSKLTLTSRTADEDAAHRIVVVGGEVVSEGPIGAPIGTTIEVRELFWNVPARLKFMKAEATEMTHAVDAVVRLALANAHVHFRLRTAGRTVLDLPPHATALERCRAALARNARATDSLVATSGGEHGVRVDAYLGPPDEAAHTTRATFLYVNRRFVRDRALLSALSMGYGDLLEKGRYPLAVVFLNVDGREVDVNVHPQKLEVRFSRPQLISATLRHVVQQLVATAGWRERDANANVLGNATSPVRVYSMPPQARDPQSGYENHRKRAAEALKLFAPPPRATPLAGSTPTLFTNTSGFATGDGPPKPAFVEALEAGLSVDEAKQAVRRGDAPPQDEPGFFSSLRYIGQLDRTYLMCEADRELVLIDQHAAHERVTFARLRESYAQRRMPTQRLLIPTTLTVSVTDAERVTQHHALLAQLGFELERTAPTSDDSATTIVLRGIPQALGRSTPEALLTEILQSLAAGTTQAFGDRSDAMLATMACHSVVRAGDQLTESEVRALLDSMEGIDYRAHQPHGRPVLLRISFSEIERRFGRT